MLEQKETISTILKVIGSSVQEWKLVVEADNSQIRRIFGYYVEVTSR